MTEHFSEEGYSRMLDSLFQRFPSFQKVGAGAYKPGVGNMEFIDQLLGHPHRKYKIIHVAGTNGKGSVSNMLASVLSAMGMKVGLYTSPHILDFRERMRVVDGRSSAQNPSMKLIGKEEVWDFVNTWKDTFDHLDMSFFEITTAMALSWFSSEKVDFVVLETGLGGRLDSTVIVNPVLSVITNIGLDHCDLLGDTLQEIAFEKAGIIKPGVPVVIGESNPSIDDVFEKKVLYTNLPDPRFMGNRQMIMSLITFADKTEPVFWNESDELLRRMDLQGEYQKANLRTVLASMSVLRTACEEVLAGLDDSDERAETVRLALIDTSRRTGFRGRWEKLSDRPAVICDIGHNAHGLKYNFAQLRKMVEDGAYSDLIIVYGSVADKDLESVLPLFPLEADYVFTQARSRRALSAQSISEHFQTHCLEEGVVCPSIRVEADVKSALIKALEQADSLAASDGNARPLIYVGGSTYVVSEAVEALSDDVFADLRNSL